MAIARVNVTIPNSFLRADGPISSNTLHFDSGATAITETNAGELATAVVACFTAIQEFYSNGAANSGIVRVYDLSDPSPRAAMLTGEFPFESGTTTLPGECAVNVSFRAVRTTGVPAQRFRGALQLGPLDVSALDDFTGRIAGACTTAVAAAFSTMSSAATAAGFNWVVGSETSTFKDVAVAKVSNEFGTVGTRQMTASGAAPITI